MKRLTTSILFMLTYGILHAQDLPVEKCATHQRHQWNIQHNPHYVKGRAAVERALTQASTRQNIQETVITIPVVVHVMYNQAIQNISDAQIDSQIDVLNEDYGRLNPDTVKTPAPFASVAGSMKVRFVLASKTPSGTATNGIIRKQTTAASFDLSGSNMKYSSKGGDDAWNPNLYLNIWVCNSSDPNTLGYATYPTIPLSNEDGVVIGYNNFGRTGTLRPYYDKGRTATHEIGHYFNLGHIWGDDNGSCSQDDGFTDTPLQANNSEGNPKFPLYDNCTKTGNGIMFENYMDYTDDIDMNLFTQQQVTQMTNVLNTVRFGLRTSSGYQPDLVTTFSIKMYPIPSNGLVNIAYHLPANTNAELRITDSMGRLVMQQTLSTGNTLLTIDENTLSAGFYVYQVIAKGQSLAQGKLVVVR